MKLGVCGRSALQMVGSYLYNFLPLAHKFIQGSARGRGSVADSMGL